MTPTDLTTQEARTERAAITVTPSEKKAIRFVAEAREMTESELLRVTPVEEIVREYERLRTLLRSDEGRRKAAS